MPGDSSSHTSGARRETEAFHCSPSRILERLREQPALVCSSSTQESSCPQAQTLGRDRQHTEVPCTPESHSVGGLRTLAKCQETSPGSLHVPLAQGRGAVLCRRRPGPWPTSPAGVGRSLGCRGSYGPEAPRFRNPTATEN